MYSASEQIPILNDTKTPDKGPKKKIQKIKTKKTNFKRTKDKPHENNVDGVSGGSILVEKILLEKSSKVFVDGDRVVKIVEKRKSSVKSVKI